MEREREREGEGKIGNIFGFFNMLESKNVIMYFCEFLVLLSVYGK
jgi:hypothetical protein